MVYLVWLTAHLFLSKLTFMHNHTSSSRFAIRGGTTGKSCEGLVGPIPMGATSCLRLITFCHMWWYHRKVLWGTSETYSNGCHVTSASHHVLPYVVIPQESPVRDQWDLFQWVPRRVCVSSRFAIRGGTTGKSCEGPVRPILMGVTSRLSLVTFCHTWWYHGKVREGWVRPIPMGTHVASES
jgi:hypothetical protein